MLGKGTTPNRYCQHRFAEDEDPLPSRQEFRTLQRSWYHWRCFLTGRHHEAPCEDCGEMFWTKQLDRHWHSYCGPYCMEEGVTYLLGQKFRVLQRVWHRWRRYLHSSHHTEAEQFVVRNSKRNSPETKLETRVETKLFRFGVLAQFVVLGVFGYETQIQNSDVGFCWDFRIRVSYPSFVSAETKLV